MKVSLVVLALFVVVNARNEEIVLPSSLPAIEPDFTHGNPSLQPGTGPGPVVRIGKRATLQNEGFSTGDIASSFNTDSSPIEIVQEVDSEVNKIPSLSSSSLSSKRDIPLEGFKPLVTPGSEILPHDSHAPGPVIRTPRFRLHSHSKRRLHRHGHGHRHHRHHHHHHHHHERAETTMITTT